MIESEILAITDEVLTQYLAASGYEQAELRAGYNHADEPSLFVTAHFKPGSGVTGGAESNAAHAALRMALLAKGEERFPYLEFRYPGDEPLGNDDEDEWDEEENA
ncbi:hypothetical protein [Methylobacterium nonmethylotrophicum]|uniref:Uncharacterized protein n=1 Tax=Methylobacterium nonmethylotrophicum TaxID=1141884 RepID=A0A4Z0NKL3_9HYPH|nr:hypothetical protein [Methylobacterium nonmethylotrophicum]TGD96934.1 hypothetical protein EU555_21360 [Methylobacterium nonmethylotrophicum]